MIRSGKADGWLAADHGFLFPWASFNGATFNGVEIMPLKGKGLAIVAQADAAASDSIPLMHIPGELVLSRETVELHAKADVHLRTLLDALGDFARTARGCILTFLLMQATACCPRVRVNIGLASPFAEYVKFLPIELLPTLWSDEENEMLVGTSLAPAVAAKMKSLYREFDLLRSSTAAIPWCQEYWWDEVEGNLTFDDWKQVDAFYRSRALEFPGIGDCMVPCVDMCNHASGRQTSALYESDGLGNALLLLRDQITVRQGEEITITYGDEKGACEMIFSYGFLEQNMTSARDIFLDLDVPDDDPLKRAKQAVSSSAPGVRLTDGASGLEWESDYVWLICVNEEDGLDIGVAQTTDGLQELQSTWKGEELQDTTRLKALLKVEPLWNVYQLRAVALLQARVENQLRAIYDSQNLLEERSEGPNIRQQPKMLARRLRELEAGLLEQFYEFFEGEKLKLVDTEEVCDYLARSAAAEESSQEDDFS